MRKDKVRAYELRRSGKSYKEIKKLLDIPLSTLGGWFKDEDWSRKIRDELGAKASLLFPNKMAAIRKANKLRWGKKYEEYRESGKRKFEILKDNPIFLAAIMLYWGEGDKNPKLSRLKLANTDPLMIRVFYLFLKDIIMVPKEKICLWLLLYPDLVDDMQKNFWSKAIGIPIQYFKKSIYIKGKHPTKRLSYGVCSIYVQSRELKEKMIVWIELYQKKLLSLG
jgi:hypothetical protein